MSKIKEAPFSKGRAWIELNMENLRHNVDVLKALLPIGCKLMPAVKANAYGHGAVPIARELNKLGIKNFCVATAQEGAELRQNRIQGVILVLGYTHPRQLYLLNRYELTQTVVDYDYAKLLNAYGQPVRVHIGVDTGMHRLGERCENLDCISEMFRMKNLCVDGVFTHLSAADADTTKGKKFTAEQGKAFYHVVEQLKERGVHCPGVHLLSSYGLLNFPELGGNYARTGIALYGILSTGRGMEHGKPDLRPVLSVKARVSSVRTLHKEEYAGYGLVFAAKAEMKIAALTIGYADGLPRSLSCGVGGVLINGCTAPIIGHICMDQTLVDVTGIPLVKAGNIAAIIGESGGKSVTVCDIARQAGTIPNDIVSRLGSRLERTAVNLGGKEIVDLNVFTYTI